MTEAEIDFTVETPMFLGGAQIGGAEFRLPSLRGAMRYWFRAFAGRLYGNDLGKVARAESSVFGAASGGAGKASAVLLRPINLPSARGAPAAPPAPQVAPAWLGPRKGVAYLLGPGLFQFPDQVTRQSIQVEASGRFALRSTSPDKAELAAICLWALSVYGGLGLRAHRGFGGISFGGLDRLCPGLPDREPLSDLASVHEEFATIASRCLPGTPGPPIAGGYPSFPSFSHWHCRVSAQRFATWQIALDEAGENLRRFRAPIDRTQPPHNRVDLEPWRKCVTQEYVDIVFPQPPPKARPPSADFELAAFGLPVVFAHEATVNLRMNGKEMRRASPLWIRPWRRPNGGWSLVYHVFEADLWPSTAQLDLTVAGKRQPVALSLTEGSAYAKVRTWVSQAP